MKKQKNFNKKVNKKKRLLKTKAITLGAAGATIFQSFAFASTWNNTVWQDFVNNIKTTETSKTDAEVAPLLKTSTHTDTAAINIPGHNNAHSDSPAYYYPHRHTAASYTPAVYSPHSDTPASYTPASYNPHSDTPASYSPHSDTPARYNPHSDSYSHDNVIDGVGYATHRVSPYFPHYDGSYHSNTGPQHSPTYSPHSDIAARYTPHYNSGPQHSPTYTPATYTPHYNSGPQHSPAYTPAVYTPHYNSGPQHSPTYTPAVYTPHYDIAATYTPHYDAGGNGSHGHANTLHNDIPHSDVGVDHQNYIPTQPQIYNLSGGQQISGTVRIGLFSFDNDEIRGTNTAISKDVYYDLLISKDGTNWTTLVSNQPANDTNKGYVYDLNTIDPLQTGNTNPSAVEGTYQLKAITRNAPQNGVTFQSTEQIITINIQNQKPSVWVDNGSEFINFVFGYNGALSPANVYNRYIDLYNKTKTPQPAAYDGLLVRINMKDADTASTTTQNWQKGQVILKAPNNTQMAVTDVIWENNSTIISSENITKAGMAFFNKSSYTGMGNMTGSKVEIKITDYLDAACTKPTGTTTTLQTISSTDATPLLFNVDIVKPTGSISINSGATTASSNNVTLNISATDQGAGVSEMMISNDSAFTSATWEAYATSKNWALTAGDGNKTVYIKFKDKLGNESIAYNASIMVDATLPTYTSHRIENVTQDGYDVVVEGVSDANSGIDRVQFPTWTPNVAGQDDLQPAWETNPIATGIDEGNGRWRYHVKRSDHKNEFGTYTTHVYIYDTAGNRTMFSAANNQQVLPDYAAELVSDTIPTNMAAGQTYNVSVQVKNIGSVTWTKATDIKLGAINDSDPFTPNTRALLNATDSIAPGQTATFTFNMTAPLTPGTYTTDWGMVKELVTWFYNQPGIAVNDIITIDGVENNQKLINRSVTVQDQTGPTCSQFTINNNAQYTTNYGVNLQIQASDASGSVAEMMISNDPAFTGATWEVYAPTKAWTLSQSGGYTKTVYIKFKDNLGNVSTTYSDSIEFEIIPTIDSVSVSATPIYLGKGVTIQATGTNLVTGKYRIFYTNSLDAPSINTTAPDPGTGWKDSGIAGDITNVTATSMSQFIASSVFDNHDWTYVTIKVYGESASLYGVNTFTNALSMNDPNAIVGYIGHNQIVRIFESGREIAVSSPTQAVQQYSPDPTDVANLSNNNTFEDGAPVKYRAEFDVINPSQVSSINAYFDFNLYNVQGIEFTPTEVVLKRYNPSNGSITNLKAYTGAGIIKESRNRYYISADTSLIDSATKYRYWVEYRGDLSVQPDYVGTNEEITNECEIEVITPTNSYGDMVDQKAPNRKTQINSRVTRQIIQYQ